MSLQYRPPCKGVEETMLRRIVEEVVSPIVKAVKSLSEDVDNLTADLALLDRKIEKTLDGPRREER